jgi:hypothetical protein
MIVPSSKPGKNLPTNDRSIGMTTGGTRSGATPPAPRHGYLGLPM